MHSRTAARALPAVRCLSRTAAWLNRPAGAKHSRHLVRGTKWNVGHAAESGLGHLTRRAKQEQKGILPPSRTKHDDDAHGGANTHRTKLDNSAVPAWRRACGPAAHRVPSGVSIFTITRTPSSGISSIRICRTSTARTPSTPIGLSFCARWPKTQSSAPAQSSGSTIESAKWFACLSPQTIGAAGSHGPLPMASSALQGVRDTIAYACPATTH